jgi:hypothetical protein
MASPADAHEPRAASCDDWRRGARWWWPTPTVEPKGGGVRVEVTSRAMLRPVLQHVEQGGAGFARGLELVRVVPVREDGPAVTQRTMSRSSHPNRQPLHPPRESPLVLSLDDQVKMIGLNGEVHNAEVVLLALRNRAKQRLEQEPIAPEARQSLSRSHRDVHRMTGNMSLARAVWDAHLASQRLATSAWPSTAMSIGRP